MEFQKGLGHLEAQKASEDQEAIDRAKRTPTASDLAGATFKKGAKVRDKISGELATVLQTSFEHIVMSPTEAGVIPLAEGAEVEVVLIRTITGRVLSRNADELDLEGA